MVQLFFDRIIDGLGNNQKMGQPKGRANNNFSRSWNLCVLNDNKKIINRSASFWLDFAAPANAQLEVINKHLHHVEVGVEGNQHPWPAELWWGQGDNWQFDNFYTKRDGNFENSCQQVSSFKLKYIRPLSNLANLLWSLNLQGYFAVICARLTKVCWPLVPDLWSSTIKKITAE